MASTIAEKILGRASGNTDLQPGDHVVCDVDIAMAHDLGVLGVIGRMNEFGIDSVWDPEKIVCPMDHIAPSHTIEDATRKNQVRKFVEEKGITNFYEIGEGISHEVLPEKGHVRPGELIVGTDSHTTTLGAFGAAGTGVGTSDMTHVFATGHTWFRVPQSIKFAVDGTLGDRITAKDLLLHIAGVYGTDVAQYRAIEFTGPAIESMPLDDRMTLSNMTIELGGKFGFTPVDEVVTDFVDERTDEPYDPITADEGATYEKSYHIDADTIEPKVSKPHKVGNVADVNEVSEVELDQVFIGSCTHGKYEDIKAAAEVLDNKSVAKGTRLIVTPASREIYGQLEENGYLGILNDAGAVITNSTCGACIGLGMGVIGEGEVCLAAMNRNFRGRMGSDNSEIYLSGPETAAASAITGHITDPREV